MATVIASTTLPTAHALEPCFTPIAQADAFAGGSENTIRWFGDTSGGFTLQASTDPAFTTIAQSATVGRLRIEHTFTELEERQYFYRVRAEKRDGFCARSDWSEAVSTIQDQTPSIAAITTEPEPLDPVPVTPPMPIFLMEEEVRLDGTSEDPPGPDVPAGAGPRFVIVCLVNTTPLLGNGSQDDCGTGDAPLEVAQVDADGTWLVRYTGDNKPTTGTYTVYAVGIDAVGNQGEEPEALGFIVIL